MKKIYTLILASCFAFALTAQTGWYDQYMVPAVNSTNFQTVTEPGNVTINYYGGASPIPTSELVQGSTMKLDVIIPPGCDMVMIQAQSNDWQGLGGDYDNWVRFASQYVINYHTLGEGMLSNAADYMGDGTTRPNGNENIAEVYWSDLHLAGGGCNEQVFSNTEPVTEPEWGFFYLTNPIGNTHAFNFSTITVLIHVDSVEIYNEWVNGGMELPDAVTAITQQPIPQSNLCANSTATFTVGGSEIISYQWFERQNGASTFSQLNNDATYAGVDATTLEVITNSTLNNAEYYCVVNDGSIDLYTDTISLSLETELPTITCLDDVTRTVDQAGDTYTCFGTEFNLLSSSDNCEVASVTNDFNDGTALNAEEFPIGTTTITWTVTDNAGNEAECSFDVIVDIVSDIKTINNNTNIIQTYPNPFNEKTTINFATKTEGKVQISIYNIAGKLVKTIMQENKQSGNHSIELNSIDMQSGLYFCEIITPDYQTTIKLILSK